MTEPFDKTKALEKFNREHPGWNKQTLDYIERLRLKGSKQERYKTIRSLYKDPRMTYKQIADMYGCTPQRVEQIVNRALS